MALTETQIRNALDLAVSAYIRQFRPIVRTAGTIESKQTFGDRPWPPIYGILDGATLGASTTGPDGQTSLPTLQASGDPKLLYIHRDEECEIVDFTRILGGYGAYGFSEETVYRFRLRRKKWLFFNDTEPFAQVRVKREVYDESPDDSYTLIRVAVDRYWRQSFILGVGHKWGVQPAEGQWITIFKAGNLAGNSIDGIPGLTQPGDPEFYASRRSWATVYVFRDLADYYENVRGKSTLASKLDQLADELESWMIEMWDKEGYAVSDRYDNLTPIVKAIPGDPRITNRRVLESIVLLGDHEQEWEFFGAGMYRTRFGLVPDWGRDLVDKLANATWWQISEWRRVAELANKVRLDYPLKDLKSLYHIIKSSSDTPYGVSTSKAMATSDAYSFNLAWLPDWVPFPEEVHVRIPTIIPDYVAMWGQQFVETGQQAQKALWGDVYRNHSVCAQIAAYTLLWTKLDAAGDSLATEVLNKVKALLEMEIGLQVTDVNALVEWFNGTKVVMPDCVGWVPWQFAVRGNKAYTTGREWVTSLAQIAAPAQLFSGGGYQAPWLGLTVGGTEAQLGFIYSLYLADQHLF